MKLIPLALPPGAFRPGTKYAAKGRWYVVHLVRWIEGVMQAVGGWTKVQTTYVDGVSTVGDLNVAEPIRGMHAWRSNDGAAHLVFGTKAKLYHLSGGALSNITPAGFVSGYDDAAYVTGAYGLGVYGAGLYGTGDPNVEVLREAATWQLDNFGEDAVGVAYSDGRVVWWDKSAGDNADATIPENSPEGCRGVVVTPERFLFALGADHDGRKISWPSQETLTDWVTAANPAGVNGTAGDFTLPDVGQLLAGRRGRGETLLWTDTSLWVARYIGGTLLYSFTQVGSACGAVSRHAMAVVDGKAIWMGRHSFFRYDGFVQPVPCEVADYVFGDINEDQLSKVAARTESDFGEVTWHYPSSGSTENDRFVTFSYREGWWSFGNLQRTSGVDRGVFDDPYAADASGRIYAHDDGASYLDVDGVTSIPPHAESGPVELGEGDQIMYVRRIVPDEKTLGAVTVTMYSAGYPTSAETTHGPYAAAQPTHTRFSGRQVRLRVDHGSAGWRWGIPRLGVVPGGQR